jgi:hypothetical protein
MSRTRQTVVVVGDQLVAGHGDGRGLGWVGRVAARTYPSVPTADFYTLAAPDEDSTGLAERCMPEASRRFSPTADNRLVLGLGAADTETGISVARARLNVANVLDAALTAEVQAFVVGPAPVRDADRNRRLAEFNTGYADVAHRRGIGNSRRPGPAHPRRRATGSWPGWSSIGAGSTGSAWRTRWRSPEPGDYDHRPAPAARRPSEVAGPAGGVERSTHRK